MTLRLLSRFCLTWFALGCAGPPVAQESRGEGGGAGRDGSTTGSGNPSDDTPSAAGEAGMSAGEQKPSSGRGGSTAGDDSAQGGDSAPGGGSTGAADSAYAHVRAVSISGDAGAYTVAVTIESADVDCDQFCNFWEILDEEGHLIFRRNLDHSHTDENGTSDPGAPGNTFTRSGGPVDLASDQVVLVRAHMSTGGYEGDVMRGSAEEGFEVVRDLPGDFAADVEFEEPLSHTCLF